MARRPHRGFTLVEFAVSMAILTVLAGISVLALRGMRTRGDFASGTGSVILALRQLRAEAYARGSSTVFIVATAGKRYWGLQDGNDDLTLDTFDPASPAATGDRLLLSGTLPSNVSFGPTDGFGGALPQPFQLVPSSPASNPAPNLGYCSFCNTTGSKVGYGMIRFTRAGVQYSGGSSAASGQQLTLMAQPAGAGRTVMTIAVLTRTGASSSFEVSR